MSEGRENPGDDEAGLGIGDLVGALYRRWWLIALLGALATSIAVSLALMLPNQYEAVATVQIDPRKKTIVSVARDMSPVCSS
jgi:uncharacterized protein involved in exopolysaccharide biosynthesis